MHPLSYSTTEPRTPPPSTVKQGGGPNPAAKIPAVQPHDTLTLTTPRSGKVRFGENSIPPKPPNPFKKVGSQAWHLTQQAVLKSFQLTEEAINDLTAMACRLALLSTIIIPAMPQFIYNFIERQTFYSPVKSCSKELIKDDALRGQLKGNLINIVDDRGKPQELYAWHIPACKKREMPTIVFSHGRNTNISHYEDYLKALSDEGFGIFIYDYPGYGKSPGRVSLENCYKAGVGAVQHLIGENVPLEKQIIMGYSLGTHITSHIAETIAKNPEAFKAALPETMSQNLTPRGVVLLNSFPNLKDAFDHKIKAVAKQKPYLPEKFLHKIFNSQNIRSSLDTQGKLQAAKDFNTLVLHGTADKELDWEKAKDMTASLNTARTRKIEFMSIQDAGHSLNKEQCKEVAQKLLKHFVR